MSDFIYTGFPFVKKCRFKEAVQHIMDILSTTLGGWVLKVVPICLIMCRFADILVVNFQSQNLEFLTVQLD